MSNFKLKKNVSSYTSEDCCGVWDNVLDPEMINAGLLSWRFDNRSNYSTGHLVSWLHSIANWHSNHETPAQAADYVEHNWEKIERLFPWINNVRDSIQEVIPYKIRMHRAWFNGHTYGLGDGIHRDSKDENIINKFPGLTIVGFVNKFWEPDWDGDIKLYRENGEVMKSISPQPGRLVAFDPRLQHKGESPNRFCTSLRMTLAWHCIVAGGMKEVEETNG